MPTPSLYSPKSLVYQEVPNDFTETRQTIKGKQILTVKQFRKSAPDQTEGPDYNGQIGVGSKDDGSAILYVSGNGPQSTYGWDLVSTGPYSDVFAHKDKSNNFANLNQTILNKQIPYIDQGFVSVDTVAIKGQGHIYIDMSSVSEPKVYLAAVSSGGGFEWVRITDHTQLDNVVMKNTQNNFKDGRQTILNQSIASVNPSLNKPAAPVRSGEMYLKKGDPSKGEKPQLWIASSTATGAFEWMPISHTLDEDVVMRNAANNFTNINQKIIGKQIMSFATRGDQLPSGYKADYDGQMYIAFKTLSSGQKDAAVWIANGDTWVPITANLDPAKVVMTDKENSFLEPKQNIKNVTDGELSQITGARIKLGSRSPIADASYKATMLGEVCIYKNDSTTPSQISIWVAISLNPSPTSNAGEWTMVYSSARDYTKFAKTDAINVFEKTQRIKGFGDHDCDVMKARVVDDERSPVGRILPFSVGETFTVHTEGVLPEPDSYEVYMSTKANDSNSWLKIYDKPLDKVVRSNEKTFFTERVYLGDVNNTKKLQVIGAREKKDGSVYNQILPLQLGETVMCTEMVNGEEYIIIYMCAMDQETTPAGQKSRKNWIEIGRRKKSELVH